MPALARRLIAACAAACALALVAAVPSAMAAPVIVVGGAHTVKKDDPYLPSGDSGELTGVPRAHRRAGASAASVSAGISARRKSTKGQRAVGKALKSARRKHRISAARYRKYRRAYLRARSTRKKLKGARGAQLGYVIAVAESMALKHQLTASRMNAVFLILDRNRQYWPHKRFPSARDHIRFKGSQLIWEYYAGEGLQLQPLVNFVRANKMHGACVGANDSKCNKRAYRSLLDALVRVSSVRGGFRAFEYYFLFDGGKPPWVSAMAQSTGLQALARGAKVLDRPRYLRYARKAMGALKKSPPVGVRQRHGIAGGTAYLQYSFAPRLFVMNAFIQTLIGLYDYNKLVSSPTARRLYNAGLPEARREVPRSDTGDWSRYSIGGPESDASYHRLLTEVLGDICGRIKDKVFCAYAKKYKGYATDPAKLVYTGPSSTTKGRNTGLRFSLSKLSAVEVSVYKGSAKAYDKVATFSRGTRSFTWKPRSAGSYTVRFAAKELRTGKGLKTRTSADIEVGG